MDSWTGPVRKWGGEADFCSRYIRLESQCALRQQSWANSPIIEKLDKLNQLKAASRLVQDVDSELCATSRNLLSHSCQHLVSAGFWIKGRYINSTLPSFIVKTLMTGIWYYQRKYQAYNSSNLNSKLCVKLCAALGSPAYGHIPVSRVPDSHSIRFTILKR